MRRTRAALLSWVLVCSAVAAGLVAAPALALSPAVETLSATSIGETTATLRGKVNPNGLETKYLFEYGTTTSYGSKTTEVSAGSGTTTLEKTQSVGGLKANTVYHYRIVASNSTGSSQGIDRTFTTGGPPEVTSWEAEIHASGEAATLKAWIDPNGHSTTYQFEYGTKSGAYTKATPVESAGSETSGKYVTYTITGLTPGTWYYWRATASYSGGKVNGGELDFLSSKVPGIVYLEPSEVSSEQATLRADLEVRNAPADYYFEYGPTTSYGTKIPLSQIEVNESGEPGVLTISATAPELKSATIYHYRVVAENWAGTHYGADRAFVTKPFATLKLGGGGTLEAGAPLKAFSSGFGFYKGGSLIRSCQETEFSGELTQNPGAVQSVSVTKMQNSGGFGCYGSGFNVKYTVPTNGLAISYTTNGSEGVARIGKFTLSGAVYAGSVKVADCKYNLELTGSFELKSLMEAVTLSGETEPVLTPEYCPGAELASGVFAVTSEYPFTYVKAE